MHAQDSPITEWKVLVHPRPDETVRGVLRFIDGTPTLTLESGEVIDSKTEGVTFSVEHEIVVGEKGESVFRELKDRARIALKPTVFRNLPYAPHLASVEEDMYPPSTYGWYGRYMMAPADLSYTYEESLYVYVAQEIQEQEQVWISIINKKSGRIFESHHIQPFEEVFLHMTSLAEYRKQRFKTPRNIAQSNKYALKILDGPSPSWGQLSYLARGISAQDLKVRETMGTSLNPLVPESIPFDTREQIKAFLAYTISITDIPKEDPIEYLEQFMGTRLFSNLLSIHLRILAQGSSPPDYVAIMYSAEKGELDKQFSSEGPRDRIIKSLINTISSPPYYNIYWKGVLKWINQLNETMKIHTRLPVTKADARKNRDAWLSRIELKEAGARINISVNYSMINLRQLVYIGRAHSWPHRHLAWSVKVRDISKRSHSDWRFQCMVMPPPAVEQVKRVMTKISEIEWSSRRINYDLYDPHSNEWNVNVEKILSSLRKKCSVRKLKREFGPFRNGGFHRISKQDAQAIDLIKINLYLDYIEIHGIKPFTNLSINQLIESLEKLQSEGIVAINYEATETLTLMSRNFLTVADGPPKQICSLAKAFLANTPTSLVFLENNAQRVYIITRLPQISAYELVRNWSSPEEHELKISFNEIYRYSDYQHNLLSRLLRKDGTWNSKVSEFLSQSRLS